jgi:hypothetical protein
VTSGVAGWLAAGPAAGHYSLERPGQNRAQKWNPKMDQKVDPKNGSQNRVTVQIEYRSCFGGPFLGPTFGYYFWVSFFDVFGYFLNRFDVKLLDLNIQARAYNCRGHVFRRWVWL